MKARYDARRKEGMKELRALDWDSVLDLSGE